MRSKEVYENIKDVQEFIDYFYSRRPNYNEVTDEEIWNIETLLSHISELEKENKFLRDENNIYRNETVGKKRIRDKIKEKQDKIEKMHPASDCVLIDDLENQIQVLKEILKGE